MSSSIEITTTRLTWEDIVVVVVYFAAVVLVGIYASCRASRNTVSGYFLAGRSMSFFTVGASLFVSNIGSEHFIGLAGSGAASGIGVGAWELNALIIIQLLGFVFVPVYIASQIYTMPEFMSKRFGGQRIRVYFAFLSLVLYIFTKCSVNLYTGALFIQQALGWDIYLSIILQIGLVAILTVTGGLTAVIYTDTLQAVLMIGGALALMAKGFVDIGGFNELWRRYPLSVTNITVPNTTCHEVNPNWNVMLREPSDPELPWPGFLFGQTPGSIWYWCTDQVIVQRLLAAKSLSHAQGATILAGFLKILPIFMLVMPGMMARVLFTDEVACVDPEICWQVCESYSGCTNIAYPKLILGIMPKGARGVMMAVLLAALMSDLDSIFNSASTMFTIDIYQRIRPKAGVKELMIVGRLFILVMVGVAIAWVPIVKETQGGQLFLYIQEVSLYLSPPVASIYLLAVLWPRCTEKGAFWGLMVGLVVGGTRLILVFVYPGPDRCGAADTRPAFLSQFHYMYYAIILFWVSLIVAVVISFLTEPPTRQQLFRTTFWTRFDKKDVNQDAETSATWGRFSCCLSTTSSREDQPQTQSNTALSDLSDENYQERYDVKNVNNDDVIESTSVAGASNVTSVNEREFEVDGSSLKLDLPDLNNQSGDELGMEQLQLELECESAAVSTTGHRCKRMFYSWLCGISPEMSNSITNEDTDSEIRMANEREEKICSLEQNPVAKIALRCLLVVILGIGVGLFCFFSLWRYEVPP